MQVESAWNPPVASPSEARPLTLVALLAVGLIFSTATQLRISTLPIGPGELALLGWGLATLALGMFRDDLRLPRPAIPFLGFWVGSLAILAFDLLRNDLSLLPAPTSYRPVVAYGFVTFLLLAFWTCGGKASTLRAVSWFIAGSTVALGAVFLFAQIGIALGPFDPWYSFRFRAWAENPNQLALQLAPIPFLALHLSRQSRRPRRRAAWLLTAAVAVVLGAATFSDALVIAWGASAAALITLDYVSWGRHRRRALWERVGRHLVVPLVGLAAAIGFGAKVYGWLSEKTRVIYEQGSQGDHRLLLWRHGLEAFGSAPVFGVGPGAHSGMAGPFLGAESHNSLIDWASNTGIVGVSAYLALIGWLALRVWRRDSPALFAALLSLLILSCFHYTFRHPIYWFALAFVACVPGRER